MTGAERKQLIDTCVREAAAYYYVKPADIMSRAKPKSVAAARAMAMALLRRRAGWSYPEIGALFGRDHTTVMTAVRKAERTMGERLAWSPPAGAPELLLAKPAAEETLQQWEERMGFVSSMEVA